MTLIILILAAMRLTRLGVWDRITMPIRKAVVDGFDIRLKVHRANWKLGRWKGSGVNGSLSYLVHCVFCTAFYAAILVAVPYLIWPHNPWLNGAYLVLAIAEAAPRLLNWEPRSTVGG